MAVRIATIGRQKNVATLAKALFDTKGSPEAQALAEEALLRANPSIAVAGAIKPGTRIVVPTEPGLSGKPLPDDIDADTEPLVAVARANAEALEKHIAGPIMRLIKETEKGTSEVEEIVDRLVKNRPEFRELGADITKNASGEAGRMTLNAKAVSTALKALANDLPVDALSGLGRLL